MAKNMQNQKLNHDIPEAAFHSAVSVLDIPNHISELLENSGFHNIGDLAKQLEIDKKKILDIRGIGPKILEQIETATELFEAEVVTMNIPYHPPPVSTLADFYKPPYQQIPQKESEKESKRKENEQIINYNLPVPSLADFFDSHNMVVVLETMSAEELKPEKKKPKKSKLDPKPKKKTKKKIGSKKKNKSQKETQKRQSKKEKATKKPLKKKIKKKSVKKKTGNVKKHKKNKKK